MKKHAATAGISAILLCAFMFGCTSSAPQSSAIPEVPASEASSSSEAPPVEPEQPTRIFSGSTELLWQLPQCEYRVGQIISDEDGFAVFYEEIRPQEDTSKEKKLFLMAQLFDAQGGYVHTVYTGVWHLAPDTLDNPYNLVLTVDDLLFKYGDDRCYSIDRITGYVSWWQYETLTQKNGATLSFADVVCRTPYSVHMRFCLTEADGTEHEINISEYDDNFYVALELLSAGIEKLEGQSVTATATVTLDPKAKTAVISNTKLTYTLDFDDLSYTLTRRYTKEMLDTLLDTSPDGTRRLYRADMGGMCDGVWTDIVLQDESGDITFLCNVDTLNEGYFFDNDTVLLNSVSELRAYDLKGNSPVSTSLMDMGSITEKDGETHPARLLVGLGIDRKNKLVLAATRPYTLHEIDQPVLLTVLDEKFALRKVIKTDFTIPAYYKNWVMHLNVAVNGDGTASLSYFDQAPVQISYQSALT